MSFSPPIESNHHKGYFSEQGRRTFTITAGILGIVFCLLQTVVPFILMLAAMPAMFMAISKIKIANLERSAFWKGAIYYVESPIEFQTTSEISPTLMRWMPGKKERPESVGTFPKVTPWLLPGEDRLWMITGDCVGFYKDKKITLIPGQQDLGGFARPFLLDGAPAVLEETPDGQALKVFKNGAWSRKDLFLLRTDRVVHTTDLQVLTDGKKVLLFLNFGDMLYVREGFPDKKSGAHSAWKPVARIVNSWQTVLLNGAPAVFYTRQEGWQTRIIGLKLGNGSWKRLFSYAMNMGIQFGVFPSGRPDEFYLMHYPPFPVSPSLVLIKGAEVQEVEASEENIFLPAFFMPVMIFSNLLAFLFPLVLALILSVLMGKYRSRDYTTGDRRVPLASLTRRAFAQAIDAIIIYGPIIISWFYYPGQFMSINNADPFHTMLQVFSVMMGELGWMVLVMIIYSFLEGAWGLTPGKWLMGIRVLRADNLQPCGFWRAFMRNLLKFVDGFFNFLVGILLIALTENWQRLGDMAARTIVIEVPKPQKSGNNIVEH